MKSFRRRLGLTQKELALLVGLGSDVQISYVETGHRIPHLGEAMMLELIFGVPAFEIFPDMRLKASLRVSSQLKLLIGDLNKSRGNRRVSYKAAQLERILASLRILDAASRANPDRERCSA